MLCDDGELRLRDGATDLEGRVEICFEELWGTVCDQFWSQTDASVTCRQLGFSFQDAVTMSASAFGTGTGPVWIADVLCSGSETLLVNCANSGVGNTDFCNGHDMDVGVACTRGK